MGDIEKLSRLKVESVVVGKAIYEGHITIEDVKNWHWNLDALISI
jgi:phosphoribosylformimino-5-aminoimidazole carboxamide ribotide isomerase